MSNPWGGIKAPETQHKDQPREQCCAKCRRGVKGFGDFPCGYNGQCPNKCHEKGQNR